MVSAGLLDGVRVVSLTDESIALAARILADLGAEVVHLEPPGGMALRRDHSRAAAWLAGAASVVVTGPEDAALEGLLRGADLVITTPAQSRWLGVDETAAPQAAWVSVGPFGVRGPRRDWRATDLGVVASSGNMYLTGDPDRAPLRCTEPAGYAHGGAEAVVAALTALWARRPGMVDVSLQEAMLVASMGGPAEAGRTGQRGRRMGAVTGRTREIWPCRDGYVSFGLRGGPARVPSLQLITRLVDADGLATPALLERDWSRYSPDRCSDEELRALEAPIAAYFLGHTMAELYAIACQTNLMLAPAVTPAEVFASEQLRAREFFLRLGDVAALPRSFARVRSADGPLVQLGPSRPAPRPGDRPPPVWPARPLSPAVAATSGPWARVRILELGSGAAGPIATRYLAEHGATVVRIESRSRPDFLRLYSPAGPEHSPLFAALNCGKLSVSLNLKHPDGVAVARRLVDWADAVSENFAPRAMRGFGLDYDTLAAAKPGLVMVSACLMGQTGPHRDYPGFGGQGSALSGYNTLTGWPDREPLGPFGTITDSLAPRFVAIALAAGLLRRRTTGAGVHVDVSQVEAALYTLSPWLIDSQSGQSRSRMGNRSPVAAPCGVFPCRGQEGERPGELGSPVAPRGGVSPIDRWVAIAVHDDGDWARLASLIGVSDPGLDTVAARLARVDEVEALVAAWTCGQDRDELADWLQSAGLEAVAVNDLVDLHSDPQLAWRGHFVRAVHPAIGDMLLERNGFRLDAPAGYRGPAPLLGEHTEMVLGDILGIDAAERARLAESGALS